jgi:hypothetical protein
MAESGRNRGIGRWLSFAVLLLAGAALGAYGYHRWQRRKQESAAPQTGPRAVCTVMAVSPGDAGGGVRVSLRLEEYQTFGYRIHTTGCRGDTDGRNWSWGQTRKPVTRTREFLVSVRRRRLPEGHWQRNYTTRTPPGKWDGGELPGNQAPDWRGPVLLVERGKPYRISVDQPLLFARFMDSDGSVSHWWLSLFSEGADQLSPVPGRYWPLRVVAEGECTVRAMVAFLRCFPTLEDLTRDLVPRYRVVEKSRIREFPANVQVSYDRPSPADPEKTASFKIDLADIPAGYDDVFFVCNLAGGLPEHPEVEIPIRRRRLHGDVYPLGVVKVARPEDDEEALGMSHYQYFPQIGGVVGYGQSIYLLDQTTLEKEVLWNGKSERVEYCPRPRVLTCDVTDDGRFLAFAYGDRNATVTRILDLRRRRIVDSPSHRYRSTVSPLQIDDSGGRFCIVEASSDRRFLLSMISIPTGEREQVPVPEHAHRRHAVAVDLVRCRFSPDLGTVAFLYSCGCMLAHDTRSGKELWEVEGKAVPRERRLDRFSFTPDGREVWLGSREDDSLSRRNAVTGDELPTVPLRGWASPRIIYNSTQFPEAHVRIQNWVFGSSGESMALKVYGTPGFLDTLIVSRGDALEAEKCIPKCFPSRPFRAQGDISLVGFVGDDHFLIKRVFFAGKADDGNSRWVSELLLVDLNLVPSLDSHGSSSGK